MPGSDVSLSVATVVMVNDDVALLACGATTVAPPATMVMANTAHAKTRRRDMDRCTSRRERFDLLCYRLVAARGTHRRVNSRGGVVRMRTSRRGQARVQSALEVYLRSPSVKTVTAISAHSAATPTSTAA